MSAHLDLDDVAAQSPPALRELQELRAENERLRERLFAVGAMADPPCFACGYDGPGYFDSSTHACAAQHHDGFGSDGEEPNAKHEPTP